jgi:hypothetical protein
MLLTHPQRPHTPRGSPIRESRVGPGSYAQASSVGKQQSSTHKSAGCASFGRATRDSQEQMYCSPQHAAKSSNNTSKDSNSYATVSGMGLQTSSKRQTAPSCGFGTASRFNNPKQLISKMHAETQSGLDSPGPIYLVARHKMKRPKTRVGTFGKTERANTNSTLSPGPGAHGPLDGSIGKQIRSRARTAPRPRFGTGTREQRTKVHMPGGGVDQFGKMSPGPARYFPPALSVKRHVPSYTFGGDFIGTGALPSTGALAPGPGTHEFRVSAGSTQYESRISSSPRCVFPKEPRVKPTTPGTRAPGVGHYTLISSTGRQIESAKKNTPFFGFGTSLRPDISLLH